MMSNIPGLQCQKALGCGARRPYLQATQRQAAVSIAEERLQSDAACGDFIHTPKGTLPDALVRHLIDLDKALV